MKISSSTSAKKSTKAPTWQQMLVTNYKSTLNIQEIASMAVAGNERQSE
jgi:hypothetical protein